MRKKKTAYVIRFVAMLLIISLVLPATSYASATNELTPRASDYLSSYNTYIYNAALGKIQVYFNVTGVNYMDEIGALTVRIYESKDQETWTWVYTMQHTSQSSMLGYDKVFHADHVDYQGSVGKYYKAYVTIWAGKNGNGDTRYMWTQPQKATLFAG